MNNKARALEIKGLSYSYKTDWLQKRIPVVNDLNLDVYEGEAFGFLGHNGAGKTTAIKAILGLTQPAAGEVRIFGQSNKQALSRKHVGYLPEHPYFYDHLKVQEIMEMYAHLIGVPRPGMKKLISDVLHLVKVEHKARAPMRALSKGLTQRVAMAQAILGEPRLLILDEPFSGLDPLGRKEFADLLSDQRKKGVTIFMSSHILGDVEFLCERASIMVKGTLKGVFDLKKMPESAGGVFELILKGFTNELKSKMQSCSEDCTEMGQLLRINFSSREEAEKALALAMSQKAVVESYRHIHHSLEDLFVKLVKEGEQLTV